MPHPALPNPALAFLHIPKTGGTSLIQALRARFDDGDCFTTPSGNISPALLREQAAALQRPSLFYGHAEHGILDLIPPARLLTVLRRPQDHAVSNYLYLQRSPGLPMHDAACALGFAAFLRAQWPALVFQAVSLDVPQSATSIGPPEEFFHRMPGIQAFLDRIDFVGCLDGTDALLHVLACAHGWPEAAPMPLLHTAEDAGIDPVHAARLGAEYQTLWNDPACAPLLAAEHCIYAQAQRIARRQFAAAHRPALAPAGWRRLLAKTRAAFP